MFSAANRIPLICFLLSALFIAGIGPGNSLRAQASEIKYIVNNVPVTTYDIARRVAFLKLQRQKGNLQQKAQEAMIDQTLRSVEMKRLNIKISDKSVEDAYANFAKSNKMSTKQMDSILAQSGVTKAHFTDFMRVQMGWSQAIRNRYKSTGQLSEQDVVQRMLQKGEGKPTATEYMLQQVIFVVPQAQRASLLGKRKNEAQSMRQRFSGCTNTREFAKGLIDVTVRDLGRILEPELPPDWKEQIVTTKPGKATPVRETPRGIEFIGVCRAREVSDDRVARMVMQNEGDENQKADELSQKYDAELREHARIINR